MAIVKRHKSSVFGLVDELAGLNTAISNEATTRAEQVGDLESLETTNKTDLVSAVNEVLNTANDATGSLKIAANLGDVEDAAEARTNLEVLSATEVAEAIAVAGVALGTNFNVADITARDALQDLDLADRVTVQDAGEGKWAIFAPSVIEEGVVTEWMLLFNQDKLEAEITAEGVKQLYESNEDTNAFTDAEKAKLGQALVADDVASVVDGEDENAATQVPSVAAVATYVAEHSPQAPVLAVAKETVVVSGNTITLANAPKNGIAGVLNFSTVRYIDGEGIAYDAPVVVTGEPAEFTISTDTADQWDGLAVQIQYVYEA